MHTIPVSLSEPARAGYDVLVGRGLMAGFPALLAEKAPAHRYAVIADHHVAELHGERLLVPLRTAGLDVTLFPFPSGEWNKTREQWASLTDRLLAARIGRDGAIIGFGGGVAGDLAGFVAATFQRGLPLVQVPTSLLAMVDASVGGKTGLDVPAGKNLVGAFHAPHAVVADIDLLATLPKSQLAAGMAEVLKHGVVADAAYFAEARSCAGDALRDAGRLEALVRRSIEIKAAIVSEDEREAGRRAVLNFGHTVAHAVEMLSGYSLLHGEAVAIGMLAEARIAEAAGIANDVSSSLAEALERLALPLEIPADLSTDALLDAMRADKKVREGQVRMALPVSIGTMARDTIGAWTMPLEESLIRQVLDTRN